MLSTQEFGHQLDELGYGFYSGVPCSFLKSLINYATCNANYIPAANEGDAVAACFGASVGGAKSVVLMQNSGLSNASSPLTSLNFPFRMPVLGFVSLRGEPGLGDEPQHELMGTVTTEFLDAMRIPWAFLSPEPARAREQLREADASVEQGQTFFFVVRKNTFATYSLGEQPASFTRNRLHTLDNGGNETPRREDVLRSLAGLRRPETILMATTGVTGRELYQIGDHSNNLYMVGSMGCISSIALGLSRQRPDLESIAIDGDGALLMRMGSLATNAAHAGPSFLHLLLDNNAHESTGGQTTVSHNVDFTTVAAACGYDRALHIHSRDELADALHQWRRDPAPTFMRLRVQAVHPDPLARPAEKPSTLVRRLMDNIAGVNEHA